MLVSSIEKNEVHVTHIFSLVLYSLCSLNVYGMIYDTHVIPLLLTADLLI